ncbi:MAG: DUF389 domain-containing protein [Bacteroidetes bacterium]|nr:DUF389 domain-containing protein [Bacteroidota bacterium]
MKKKRLDRNSPSTKIRLFLRRKFNLKEGMATQEEVTEHIKNNIAFKGTKLWILMFAIVIASIGLNLNSTAVIIGAMLISPLMGPIIGIGLSLGINDFELLKRAFKNFMFAVGMSLMVSTLYFLISPLQIPQSELISRTSPTIWDVLIATFGGLAGVVAQTRKDRSSTVIPGVAIATALMPPICTAGFGLASGNWMYFGGALYLFFINSVFIAFATFFIVRMMKYQRKHELDAKRNKTVNRYISIIITATIIPSIILAWNIVQKAVFETNANEFVTNTMKFEKSEVVHLKTNYSRNGSTIEVTLIGANVDTDVIDIINSQMEQYNLKDTKLIIRQATASEGMNNEFMEHILVNNTQVINEKNSRISELERLVNKYVVDTIPSQDIAKEIISLWPQINEISLSKTKTENIGEESIKKTTICVLSVKEEEEISEKDQVRLKMWLKRRTKSEDIKLFFE